MTTKQLQDYLVEALDEIEIENEPITTITYQEAGVLTYDAGLIVSTHGGEEFQLTLVQSK